MSDWHIIAGKGADAPVDPAFLSCLHVDVHDIMVSFLICFAALYHGEVANTGTEFKTDTPSGHTGVH